MSLTREAGLRPRGQAPDHPRHLRAVLRLLRRLLRAGAEGAHADHPRLRRRRSRQVDVLVAPTTPTVAFPLGRARRRPVPMYLADLCTIPSNLDGGPAISVPCGLSEGLPVGLQIMAPAMADDRLLPGRRRAGGRCSTADPARAARRSLPAGWSRTAGERRSSRPPGPADRSSSVRAPGSCYGSHGREAVFGDVASYRAEPDRRADASLSPAGTQPRSEYTSA